MEKEARQETDLTEALAREAGTLERVGPDAGRAPHEAIEPDVARIAGMLRARMELKLAGTGEAGETRTNLEQAIAYAHSGQGRRLHDRISGDILLAAFRGLGGLARRTIVEPLRRWSERSRRRQDLARLDDRMLRDIGLSRSEVAYASYYGTHPSR